MDNGHLYLCQKRRWMPLKKYFSLPLIQQNKRNKAWIMKDRLDALNRSSIKVEMHPEGRISSANELFLNTLNYTEKEFNW